MKNIMLLIISLVFVSLVAVGVVGLNELIYDSNYHLSIYHLNNDGLDSSGLNHMTNIDGTFDNGILGSNGWNGTGINGDYLSSPSNSSYIDAVKAIEFWVNDIKNSDSLMSSRDTTGDNEGTTISTTVPSGSSDFGLTITQDTGGSNCMNSYQMGLNTTSLTDWTHILLSKEESTNNTLYYVNGLLIHNKTPCNGYDYFQWGDTGDAVFFIGANRAGTFTWEGSVDEFVVWKDYPICDGSDNSSTNVCSYYFTPPGATCTFENTLANQTYNYGDVGSMVWYTEPTDSDDALLDYFWYYVNDVLKDTETEWTSSNQYLDSIFVPGAYHQDYNISGYCQGDTDETNGTVYRVFTYQDWQNIGTATPGSSSFTCAVNFTFNYTNIDNDHDSQYVFMNFSNTIDDVGSTAWNSIGNSVNELNLNNNYSFFWTTYTDYNSTNISTATYDVTYVHGSLTATNIGNQVINNGSSLGIQASCTHPCDLTFTYVINTTDSDATINASGYISDDTPTEVTYGFICVADNYANASDTFSLTIQNVDSLSSDANNTHFVLLIMVGFLVAFFVWKYIFRALGGIVGVGVSLAIMSLSTGSLYSSVGLICVLVSVFVTIHGFLPNKIGSRI